MLLKAISIKNFVNAMKHIKMKAVFCMLIVAGLSALAVGYEVVDEHTLMMFLLFIFAMYHRWVRVIVLFNLLVFLCYSVVGFNYGKINISMIASLMDTNINESLEFFSTLSIQSIFLSILYAVTIVLFFKNPKITINNQQSTINNQQSTINNQQSTINNQQSTINNQQNWYFCNFYYLV